MLIDDSWSCYCPKRPSFHGSLEFLCVLRLEPVVDLSHKAATPLVDKSQSRRQVAWVRFDFVDCIRNTNLGRWESISI